MPVIMNAPPIADLLWGHGDGLTATLAEFPVPSSVLSAARNNQLVGNVYDTTALNAYTTSNFGQVDGYPVLNQYALPSAVVNGWNPINGCTVALNKTPPAGCPTQYAMTVTPAAGGGGNNPFVFSPGITQIYPNVSYTLSSTLFAAAVGGTVELTIGIVWFDAAEANILREDFFEIPSPTAGVWTPMSLTVPASPAGAGLATLLAGLSGPTVNVADVCSIAGLYLTTPYA